jgi:hypothetical protein
MPSGRATRDRPLIRLDPKHETAADRIGFDESDRHFFSNPKSTTGSAPD